MVKSITESGGTSLQLSGFNGIVILDGSGQLFEGLNGNSAQLADTHVIKHVNKY
jgi:hypothetical protein